MAAPSEMKKKTSGENVANYDLWNRDVNLATNYP